MKETKRMRLVFKDEGILSEAQMLDGLNRSWVLLNSETTNISELAAHIHRVFQLQQSCPRGLILSLSGFVLPSHESTHILKDGDIVRVRRKLGSLSIEGNDRTNEVQLLLDGKDQPVDTGVVLLANEEFEREKGGYESDEPGEEEEGEEKAPEALKSHKRKAPEKLQNSKKKKRRAEASASLAKSSDLEKDAESSGHGPASAKSSDKSGASASGLKRAEHNGDAEDVTQTQEIKKRPSRSARRKSAKRQWLREMAKIRNLNSACESESLCNWKQEKAKGWRKNSKGEFNGSERKRSNGQVKKWLKNADHQAEVDDDQPKGLLHWNQSPQDNFVKGNKHKSLKQRFQRQVYPNGDGFDQPSETCDDIDEKPSGKDGYHQELEDKVVDASNQEIEKENEVFPIVVKPGHIRFEPLEEDEAIRQNHDQSDTIHWNGITSKKKGQKWGREDRSSAPRNEQKKLNKEHSEALTATTNTATENQPLETIEFDKLPPLTCIPKEGDIIAYRIVELSSTWTPELSAYRVGRVSWFDTSINLIMVAPVQEYPIVPKGDEADEAMQLDNSLYKEDGSLEIDFASLIDVRIFKTNPEKSTEDILPQSKPENQTVEPRSGNGEASVWDQMIETLNSKKEELSKEKSAWEKSPKNVAQENSGKSWSYKGLRGSALGATMSMLRSKNMM